MKIKLLISILSLFFLLNLNTFSQNTLKEQDKILKGLIRDLHNTMDENETFKMYYNSYETKYKFRDYDGALSDINKLVAINSKVLILFELRGNIYIKRKLFDAALLDFNKVIDEKPNFVTYYNRGTLKDLLKDHDGAIQDYNKSIALNPKFAACYFNRGNSLLIKKDYDGAISDYQTAIKLKPDYRKAKEQLQKAEKEKSAKAVNSAGFSEEITQDLDKAIELNPDFDEAYLLRAEEKRKLKDFSGAISDFSKAINLNPNNAKAYHERAKIKYYNMQKTEEACADWKKASELGHSAAKLWYNDECK